MSSRSDVNMFDTLLPLRRGSSSGAVGRHGDAGDEGPVHRLAASVEIAPQRAGDDGQHDVVQRDAERLLDPLEVVERTARSWRTMRFGVSAVLNDVFGHVHDRPRRHDVGLAPVAGDGPRTCRACARAGRAGDGVPERTPTTASTTRRQVEGTGSGFHGAIGRRRIAGVGRRAHHVGEHRRGGHTVGRRVVDLGDERDRAVGQTLEHVHLPQRTPPVELSAGDERRSPRPSAAAPPGAATRPRCTWLSMSKSGSSIHTGWCSPNGMSTRRRRNGGSRWSRLASSSLNRSKEYPPGTVDGSSSATFSVCMWTVGVSMYR